MEGTVHRGGRDGRLRACKQLRRQLADGAQLLEGGEEMCALLEQEASAFGEGGSDGSRMLTTSLVAFVRDEPGALLALTQVATAKALSILDISSRSRSRSDAWPAMGAFEVRVRLHSLAQLEELTTALEQLPQARP